MVAEAKVTVREIDASEAGDPVWLGLGIMRDHALGTFWSTIRDLALFKTAILQANNGLFPEALATAQEIDAPIDRAWAFANIVALLPADRSQSIQH